MHFLVYHAVLIKVSKVSSLDLERDVVVDPPVYRSVC